MNKGLTRRHDNGFPAGLERLSVISTTVFPSFFAINGVIFPLTSWKNREIAPVAKLTTLARTHRQELVRTVSLVYYLINDIAKNL